MTTTKKAGRLQSHLTYLISLETAIERKLEQLLPEVLAHSGVTTLLTSFKSLAGNQRQALETRLQTIGGAISRTDDSSVTLSVNGSAEVAKHPVSKALQTTYTLFNQAIVGYAVLHPLATRFLDSVWIAEEGTSQHLCRQHMQNYIEAIQQISHLLHDAILWELDEESLECQCVCPSCGVGVCVCALAGRSYLRDAWVEAGPIANDEGVYIQTPKQNSAAAKIGLHHGDVIIAAEGQEIESYGDLQDVVGNTESGGEIHLKVLRRDDVKEDVVMIHP